MSSTVSAPPRAPRHRSRGTNANEPLDPAPHHDRALGRRATLPAGRAIVGGLLVTVAAVGTFAAFTATTSPPTHHYVVANGNIAEGQRLTADDLRVVFVELPDDVATRAFAETDRLVGATVLAPLESDQLIAPANVRLAAPVPGAPPGSEAAPSGHEFSFAIDRENALNGHVQRGESVDLVSTYGSGNDAFTEVVLRGARVLDIDTIGKSTVGSGGKVTITVSVGSDAQVLAATHAIEVGKVTLIRPTGADDGTAHDNTADRYQPEPPSTAPNRSGSSGRSTTTTTPAGSPGPTNP